MARWTTLLKRDGSSSGGSPFHLGGQSNDGEEAVTVRKRIYELIQSHFAGLPSDETEDFWRGLVHSNGGQTATLGDAMTHLIAFPPSKEGLAEMLSAGASVRAVIKSHVIRPRTASPRTWRHARQNT